jgi:hypothetical protein
MGKNESGGMLVDLFDPLDWLEKVASAIFVFGKQHPFPMLDDGIGVEGDPIMEKYPPAQLNFP